MSAQQVLEALLQLGGAPVQLAALAWLLLRVEQMRKAQGALELRIELLELLPTAHKEAAAAAQDARARG